MTLKSAASRQFLSKPALHTSAVAVLVDVLVVDVLDDVLVLVIVLSSIVHSLTFVSLFS